MYQQLPFQRKGRKLDQSLTRSRFASVFSKPICITLLCFFTVVSLALHWTFFSTCEYQPECIKKEVWSYSNLAHKGNVIYTLILKADGTYPVRLPWFLFYELKRDKELWNNLSNCGITFTPVRFTTEHAEYVHPDTLATLDKKIHLSQCIPENMQDHILFVGRGKNKRRSIVDEPGLVDALRKRIGRKIIYIDNMGKYSLNEQAIFFKQAAVIISMHGAQLAGTTFAGPESIVMEIQPCLPNGKRCQAWRNRPLTIVKEWLPIKIYGHPSEKAIRYPRDMEAEWNNEMVDLIHEKLRSVSYV
mmetsp:Transcript_4852/g.5605  ORF Transcript_4852/g.5605 Transcript_4852/m.5605 type:complete len:302 (+) Transcript_4852:434-1339(+)